jgi:predicted nuclease with RNAse H fold
MITAGIDLASQPDRTAACMIEWGAGRGGVVQLLPSGVDDDQIGALIREADWTGIDVPLGWPDGFIAAVSAHHAALEWAGGELAQLRMRATDEWVHRRTGRWPLSVSTDRIGVPALRAARVLSEQPTARDRSGAGPVVEVYPAAALRIWGFESRRYKRVAGTAARAALVAAFGDATERWLHLSDADWDACALTDDAFDALISALVARAAACRLVDRCPTELQAVASREGWIMLPLAGSLARLGGAADTME